MHTLKTSLLKLSVSNLKELAYIEGIPSVFIFKFETPRGLADLTASTMLDAVPHRRL